MQWIKSRSYECPPNKECDGDEKVTKRLRSDGAILTARTRVTNGQNLDEYFAEAVNRKSPWTGITEDVYNADFEKQMKEDNGTEIKEEENATNQK